MHVTYNFNFGFGNSLLCLSCVCEWDGWGRDGWDGFSFLPFGYGVETFFCLNILAIIFSLYEKFMHGVWDLNHFFPLFYHYHYF